MNSTRLLSSLACIVIAASCAKAPPPQPAHNSKADEAAIRATTDTFLKAFNAGDANGASANTMADAVEMRPDGPELAGKTAIMAEATANFAANTATQNATVDEVAVWGDVAMSRGTWQVTQTPKTGNAKATNKHGKWIVIHKRAAEGSWQEWRHMWNEDHSAGTAPK